MNPFLPQKICGYSFFYLFNLKGIWRTFFKKWSFSARFVGLNVLSIPHLQVESFVFICRAYHILQWYHPITWSPRWKPGDIMLNHSFHRISLNNSGDSEQRIVSKQQSHVTVRGSRFWLRDLLETLFVLACFLIFPMTTQTPAMEFLVSTLNPAATLCGCFLGPGLRVRTASSLAYSHVPYS